ncbi:MAG: hypothetical protein QG673_1828 [Pseudomonadota bacterium]|nr:hypothetical protein [Pseudomonadota bacterium]
MAQSFKTEDSFLKKLAVGAEGTKIAINELTKLGFQPIELERGSSGFKIWKEIKIKSVRVPDVLCLKTGLRVESRGKTKLEISMSHSTQKAERAWDFGMRDDDLVTIVLLKNTGSPIEWIQDSPLHFISIKDMRQIFQAKHVKITEPKGVEEGSEIRCIWQCAESLDDGVIEDIDDNYIKIKFQLKSQKIKLNRKINRGTEIKLLPCVKKGDMVQKNQIVASIVPVHLHVTPSSTVNENYFLERLTSINLSDRYAAAKALRYKGYHLVETVDRLRALIKTDDNVYVRLEAAAALSARNYKEGWDYLEHNIMSDTLTVPETTQLETVIILSEIKHIKSEQLLTYAINQDIKHEEIRSGAAWALGQFPSETSVIALVDTFTKQSFGVKNEAVQSLLRIGSDQIDMLTHMIKQREDARDGIAWVLARIKGVDLKGIISIGDNNLDIWASYILGVGKDNFEKAVIEEICSESPKVYFAASVLWQIISSWINKIKEY